MRGRLTLCALLTLVLMAGCTSFDPLDQTGKTINRNATDYANDAMLLNVIRATNSEPLTFITITSLNGTQSATAALGVPTIVFGTGTGAAPGSNSIGPNAVSRTNTNSFQMYIPDECRRRPGLFRGSPDADQPGDDGSVHPARLSAGAAVLPVHLADTRSRHGGRPR